MNGDPNLRARLERLASNAGDPPERGLDRVAARRHRRLRRRRGAVVTAAALAVLLGGVSLVMGGSPDDDHVAVSPARRPGRAAAQLPEVVEVYCKPGGIDIPVASVRPQRDGMHLRVINRLATPVEVRVVKEEVWTGRQSFPTGLWPMVQPVPPGSIQIGCFGAGVADSNTVELVDVHSYYTEPSLACPEDEQVRVTDLGGADPARSMSTTTRNALDSQGVEADELDPRPVRGYLSQRFSDPTDDPVVQVNRRDGDDPVAFVHLRRTGDRPDASWEAVAIDTCPSFLSEDTSTERKTASG